MKVVLPCDLCDNADVLSMLRYHTCYISTFDYDDYHEVEVIDLFDLSVQEALEFVR